MSDNKKVCRNFTRTGSCRFGDKCRFAHVTSTPVVNATQIPSKSEVKQPQQAKKQARPKKPCRTFMKSGECRFGDECRFVHKERKQEFKDQKTAPLKCCAAHDHHTKTKNTTEKKQNNASIPTADSSSQPVIERAIANGDVVLRNGEYGLVISDGDMSSESDNSSDDEDDNEPQRKKGVASIFFLDRTENIPVTELSIVDREFLHGDAVLRPVPGEGYAEFGVVEDVDMKLDIKCLPSSKGTGRRKPKAIELKGVSSHMCSFVHPYTEGTVVEFNGHVGMFLNIIITHLYTYTHLKPVLIICTYQIITLGCWVNQVS